MHGCLKAVKVTNNVWWVGAIDWGLTDFHGYTTHRGSTYNAFLVMSDKITLIDTVKAPFKNEMYSRIASVVDPSKIDIVVSNHSEMDHSGCLPQVISDFKPEKVYASVNGVKALDAHFGLGSAVTPVKTGDSISLGNMSIQFVETRMLHWPDSMFSYIPEEKILFSQDAFGMHLATDKLFVDENDWSVVEQELRTYYANILLLYSQQVLKLIEDFPKLGLSLDVVACDHGPLWRGGDIAKAIGLYAKWATQAPTDKAVILYDTMWQSTEKMSVAIVDGLIAGGARVSVVPLAKRPRSDAATELIGAGALIVGSPTMNNNMYPKVADVLCYLKGLRPKNLIGAAFGSYGWSGESIPQVNEVLKSMNVELVSEGVKAKYVPTEEDYTKCFELGLQIGKRLAANAAKS